MNYIKRINLDKFDDWDEDDNFDIIDYYDDEIDMTFYYDKNNKKTYYIKSIKDDHKFSKKLFQYVEKKYSPKDNVEIFLNIGFELGMRLEKFKFRMKKEK